jgi:Alginate lyase
VAPADGGPGLDAEASDASVPPLPDGGGGGPLDPNAPPGKNFDLSIWNLTLPTGNPGTPTLITTAQLIGGYTSQYFFTAPDGAMTMWCPVMGVTTPNAKNPRSELRETQNGANYNWLVTAGTATLTATLMVSKIPSVGGKVVVGQIHGDGTTVYTFLEIAYQSGTVIAEVTTNPTTDAKAPAATLATGIGLGTKFEYSIVTTKAPDLTISINGQTMYHQPVDPSWLTPTMYFKAGSYPQANQAGTGATDGAQVSFYALSASHGP